MHQELCISGYFLEPIWKFKIGKEGECKREMGRTCFGRNKKYKSKIEIFESLIWKIYVLRKSGRNVANPQVSNVYFIWGKY